MGKLNFSLKLQAPLLARKAKLQDAERLKRFLHDVEDEEAWIREKEPIASSTNTGRDLTGAQNLSKKHQALMVSAFKYCCCWYENPFVDVHTLVFIFFWLSSSCFLLVIFKSTSWCISSLCLFSFCRLKLPVMSLGSEQCVTMVCR